VQDNCCDPKFQSVLTQFDSELLRSPQMSICGIWEDFSIAYLSPGWYRFARENMGEPRISQHWRIGDNLLSGIHGPLSDFFQEGYQRCLRENRPWHHRYECSSASLFRECHMVSYPVSNAQGLLIFHSVQMTRPHQRSQMTHDAFRDHYADDLGHLHQCSYCRRFQQPDSQVQWDWIPDWIDNPPEDLSHGICNSCASHYSKSIQNGDEGLPPFEMPEPT